MTKIEFGEHVRDTISGFEGIATGHADFMTGCAQTQITPRVLQGDGSPVSAEWFDDPRVEVSETQASNTIFGGRPENGNPPD